MKSGQILILVLLIVVVTLAVGLSVASRNITNLRTATQTEHSQRAFSAAEGGVESILSKLSSVAPPVGSTYTESVPVGDINANVVVKSSDTYEKTIELGEVGQVDLLNSGRTVFTLQVEWAKKSDPSELDQLGPASIEVVQISGTGAPYSQARVAYSGVSGRDEQGFSSANCSSTGDFKCSVQITIQPSAKILRIRPFWVKTTVRVSGGQIPVQTYDVTSTAATELGLTRKVQVTKSALPLVPAVFDFAAYSESDLVK